MAFAATETPSGGTHVPNFPHPHYHSYAIRNQRMIDINANLRIRAEDTALIANRIGAQSIMDVGSNLGGFLFFMEQFGGRTDLLGVEGDSRFVKECRTVSRLLGSRVKFQNSDIMSLAPPEEPYDSIILQNVYHYIYDKVGDHETIFRHLGRHGRSIIWYNPMNDGDPVIPKHANSNPNTNWAVYNSKDIFRAALKAGFLHPIPLKLRFIGMGAAREHWLFIRDDVRALNPRSITLDSVAGKLQPVRDHFAGMHQVFLDEDRSYKVFLIDRYGQMQRVQNAVSCGFLDRQICDGLEYIVNEENRVVGYSQPRGTELLAARAVLGGGAVERDFKQQLWRLFSRMIRHDCFNHDVGRHNFVYEHSRSIPMLIDLENIVEGASKSSQLSIYRVTPDANEKQSAEANLRLLFPDVSVVVGSRDPISVLQECLLGSKFLSELDFGGGLFQRQL
jgi:SAM-dependent methyltransferase